MSEYCDGGQLGSIEGQLDSVNTRLFTLQEQLDEIIKFLADFKKLIGEPTWMEAPPDTDDKRSTLYFKKNWGEPSWMEAPKGDDKPS